MESLNICGDIFYFENSMLHGKNSPSIEFKNGTRWWLQKGKLHRDNGPAMIGKKEIIEYWLNGEPATEEEIKNIKRNKWIDKSV